MAHKFKGGKITIKDDGFAYVRMSGPTIFGARMYCGCHCHLNPDDEDAIELFAAFPEVSELLNRNGQMIGSKTLKIRPALLLSLKEMLRGCDVGGWPKGYPLWRLITSIEEIPPLHLLAISAE